MQYTVMKIMVLRVTFTVVHEVTLSVEDWQIYIFGGETCERERDHLEDLSVEEGLILKWIFRKWDGGGAWTGLIWLRRGTGGGNL